MSKNKWTTDELIFIKENARVKTCNEMASYIPHSPKSIKLKLNRIGLKSSINLEKIYNCLNCSKDIVGKVTSERKFCNQKCSAIFNNKKRILKPRLFKIDSSFNESNERVCLVCAISLRGKGRYLKYCSRICEYEAKRNVRFLNVEKGVNKSSRTIKAYLINMHGDCCMECGWNKINPITNKVPIELEHIDGNSNNNDLNNLKLLCPNCHSLTATYKALNKGNGRYKRRQRFKDGKSF